MYKILPINQFLDGLFTPLSHCTCCMPEQINHWHSIFNSLQNAWCCTLFIILHAMTVLIFYPISETEVYLCQNITSATPKTEVSLMAQDFKWPHSIDVKIHNKIHQTKYDVTMQRLIQYGWNGMAEVIIWRRKSYAPLFWRLDFTIPARAWGQNKLSSFFCNTEILLACICTCNVGQL